MHLNALYPHTDVRSQSGNTPWTLATGLPSTAGSTEEPCFGSGGAPQEAALGELTVERCEQVPHNAAREGRVDTGSKALDAQRTRGRTGKGEGAQETLEGESGER